MKKTKKDRSHKKHRPREMANPLTTAMIRVAKLTLAEQTAWMQPINTSFDRLRRGEAKRDEWNLLADILNIAMALTKPEVARLLDDHKEKFAAAMDALAALAGRIKKTGSWTCYASELTTIETAIEFFCYQLQFASRHELVKAQEYAANKIRGAISGSPGCDMVQVN